MYASNCDVLLSDVTGIRIPRRCKLSLGLTEDLSGTDTWIAQALREGGRRMGRTETSAKVGYISTFDVAVD